MKKDVSMYDYFISYKKSDSQELCNLMYDYFKSKNILTWFDEINIMPGDSIVGSIENGILSSVDSIIIVSENYFSGWSEKERRTLIHYIDGNDRRIIPIWYKVDYSFIHKNAPFLVDKKALQIASLSENNIREICDRILSDYHVDQRRNLLFKLYFKALSKKFPKDQDLKLFIGVWENDIELLKSAIENGGNVNCTDTEIWNRYSKIALEAGIFEEWRHLFLFLEEQGQIGNRKNDNEKLG